MSNPSTPVIRQPAQGRTVAVIGDVYRFLATGEDTGGRYALWEAVVPPGGGPPPHVHRREEEGFYVLEGEITFTVNGERVVAPAGTFANMPVGTPHSFKNESDRPARMLISVAREDDVKFRGLCEGRLVTVTRIGVTDGEIDGLDVQDRFTLSHAELAAAHRHTLPERFGAVVGG